MNNIVAFDLETNGLDPRAEDFIITGIGLYSKKGKKFYYMPTKEDMDNIIKLLGDRKLVGHNIIFDLNCVYVKFGVDLTDKVAHDTMLLGHLINENHEQNLDFLAKHYLGEEKIKINKKHHELTEKELCDYCLKDVEITYNLCDCLLNHENLPSELYENEVMPLYREVTIPMKYKGLRINEKYFKKMICDLQIANKKELTDINLEVYDKVEDIRIELLDKTYTTTKNSKYGKEAIKLFGTHELPRDYEVQLKKHLWFLDNPHNPFVFNIKSNDQLAWLLFKQLGESPIKYTEKGLPSVDAKTLQEYKHVPIIEKLLHLRKEEKILGTYAKPILEKSHDGWIYPDMIQTGTTSGRYASRNPNCLSLDTEILTMNGWKTYESINKYDWVACFDGNNTIFFPFNTYYLSEEKPHTMITFNNQHINIRVTDNHRCVFKDRKNGQLKIREARRWLQDSKILHGAILNSHNKQREVESLIKLKVAIQADAEINGDTVRFRFSKERKYVRLVNILKDLAIEYEDKSKKLYEIKFKHIDAKCWKTFSTSFFEMNTEDIKILVEELQYWDGCKTKSGINYSSNYERNVDIVQGLCTLIGYRAHKRFYTTKAGNKNYQLDITRKDHSYTTTATRTYSFDSMEKVWCLEVPTGMFVARRGSDTFITGNCQNLPSNETRIKEGIVAPKGYKIVVADFPSLEPRCFAEMSNCPSLIDVFKRGEDLYSRIAIDVFGLEGVSAKEEDDNFLKKVNPKYRNIMKVVALAVVYGAGAGRLSKILGISKTEAQDIIDKYLCAYPELREYMNKQEEKALAEHEVSSIFGRVRHMETIPELDPENNDDYWKLRKMLNLAKNHPIQALAAHITNHAAIDYTRALKENGIDGQIVLQVHDSIVSYVKKNQANRAAQLLSQCMEHNKITDSMQVPIGKVDAIICNKLSEEK